MYEFNVNPASSYKTQSNNSVHSNQPSESLADSLSCKALHLDVEELSEVTEPFYHLGGHTAVKLESGQENSRTGSEQVRRARDDFI